MARMMSVDLSMTITAAVPSADFVSRAAVEIHQQRVALIGAGRHQRHRRAAGDHGEQIVPAAAHAAGMRLDQFAQAECPSPLRRCTGFSTWPEMQNSLVPVLFGPADAGEPGGAAPHDVGHHRDRLDVVDRGRAAIEADIGRERRLQPRLALLAFQAFQQRRLLAADIGAGAVVDVEVEVPAVDVVLADQLGLIGLVDRRLQALALADEFAAHVDVAGMGAHGEAGDQAALDQQMRIVPHDLAVLAGAGLGFVGIDDEIMRPLVRLLGHERPFQAGREAGAAAARAGPTPSPR